MSTYATLPSLEQMVRVKVALIEQDWEGLMVELNKHQVLAVESEEGEILGVLMLPEIYRELAETSAANDGD